METQGIGSMFCHFSIVLVLGLTSFTSSFVLDSQSLTCYDCRDVDDPKDCSRISTCGRDELCFVHYAPMRTSAFRYVYQMNCLTFRACEALKLVVTSTSCAECCNTSYCNVNACDTWTTPNFNQHTLTSLPTTRQWNNISPTTSTLPAKPIISGQSSAVYTGDVHLNCMVSGNVLAINWFRNKTDPLPPEVTSSGGFLAIHNLNESRAGMYSCIAVGQNGLISVSSIVVTIQDTPAIVVSVVKTPPILSSGQQFSIKCDVIGYPKPKVTWDFTASDGTRTVPSGVFYSADQTTLLIQHYNIVQHNGRWTCIATNYFGKSQAHIDIP